jgi:ferredoxin-NADP reductase
MNAVFLEKVQETPTDWSFRYSLPEGYTYKAGQYSVIRVPPKRVDYRNNVRTCSTSSSPTEPFIQFTFTIRSTGFKDTLMDMVAGEEVDITPARGKMILDEIYMPRLVMIAGGIGVAPFRGMIKYAYDTSLQDTYIQLLYSDKTIAEIAYKKEFDQIVQERPNIDVVYTLTRHEDWHGDWIGKQGRINAEFMLNHVEDFENTQFMVCGPVDMVRSAMAVLESVHVPRERIIGELFTGY